MLFKFMKKILTFFILLISTYSFAADYKSNFNIEEFKSAQNDGKVVIVHSWNKFCTTCAKQKSILEKALTHKSYNNNINNEKLEFLGDRVLGLIISERLLEKFPEEKE